MLLLQRHRELLISDQEVGKTEERKNEEREERRDVKEPVSSSTISAEHYLHGDTHSQSNGRQVTPLSKCDKQLP